MLLRVEILPPNPNQNSQSQSQPSSTQPAAVAIAADDSSSPPPLYFNLNAASHHREGILLQVGRKNADLTFPNEKSVSRTHCRLRLISSEGRDGEDGDGDDDGGDMEGNNEPLRPSNKEEEAICEGSMDGWAIVIDDLGSKFGTKAYYTLSTNSSTNNKASPAGDAAESDSETDDETDNDEHSSELSSPNNNNIVKSLEKNGSIVLPSLSIPHHYNQQQQQEKKNTTNSSNTNHNDTQNNTNACTSTLTAIIQCGTARFRVTRIPLTFCLSRTSSSDKKKISAAAPSIGAHIVQSLNESTTHLIAPDRTGTAKTICAWVMSIPVVSSTYVLDWMKRKDARSALPNSEDYIPQGTLQMDNLVYKDDEPRRIFKDYIILSLMETEAEMICKCGGATIRKLYRDDSKDVVFWQEESFFENLVKESRESEKVVCWLNCTSRKVKKGKDYLMKKMKEGQKLNDSGGGGMSLSLRCIGQSQVVEAISNLTALKDIDGVELTLATEESEQGDHGDDGDDEKESQSLHRDKGIASTDSTLPTSIHQSKAVEKPLDTIEEVNEIDDKDTVDENSSKPQQKENKIDDGGGWVSSKRSQTKPKTNATAPQEKANEIHSSQTESTKVRGSNNSISGRKKKSVKEGSQWISTNQKSSRSVSSNNEESQNSGWISSQKRTSKSKKLGSTSSNKEDSQLQEFEMIDEEVYDEPIHNEKKRKVSLPVTSDGWYLAPKGKKRAKYKRDTTDQIFEDGGPSESAQTETSSLIVRKNIIVDEMRPNTNNQRNRKDFKRFRKNSIIKGAIEHSFNNIRFVSLLPKESERQRELKAAHLEHERQECAGDSLFADTGGANKRGIKSYLKPSGRSSRKRG